MGLKREEMSMKNKQIFYNSNTYSKCNFYEHGGYCSRMDSIFDERAEHLEICPVCLKKNDWRYEGECPYAEPQASIDEENEIEKYYGTW